MSVREFLEWLLERGTVHDLCYVIIVSKYFNLEDLRKRAEEKLRHVLKAFKVM